MAGENVPVMCDFIPSSSGEREEGILRHGFKPSIAILNHWLLSYE